VAPPALEAARVAAERGHRVTLREAGSELGGQWRLAGRQPTRSQVLDHLAWYERELSRLDVDVRVGEALDAAAVQAVGADEIVVAIGARPSRAGFQRALPMADRLPGIDHARAASVEDVLAGQAAPEGGVLLVDDLGDWRGIGTALFLQDSGCDVTLVTSAPAVASGLFHSAADIPTRRRFARAGGETATHAVVASWTDGVAVIRSTLTDEERTATFDWLVVAETPTPRSELSTELEVTGVRHHRIGDCVAARRASLAIYEGRRLGLSL
jgi:pyruvate/2-oxoglutarate dehydrogenase complex dihydrolipoamide dehydrogenase (E3) component